MPSREKSYYPLILILFLGTGACGLIYQTVWVRQLSLAFGISTYAISAVLAAFMSGLSLGAFWIGRHSDRFRNPLRVYAYFEIAIALYAGALYYLLKHALPWVYQAAYPALSEHHALLFAARYLFAFLLLLIPTTMMGGTLPILGHWAAKDRKAIGNRLGALYGLNTIGAMLGTAIAGFWLLKDYGVLGTTAIAATANFLIALIALGVSFKAPTTAPRAAREAGPELGPEPAREAGHEPARTAAPAPASESVPGTSLVLLMLFLSGYSALAYEVMWNRILVPYIHNSVYAFSSIVILFLLGTGAGSLLYSRFARQWTSRRVLGLLQVAIAAYVWGTIVLVAQLPPILQRVTEVFGTGTWLSAMATIATATGLVVLFPTLLMGMTFPMATALCAGGDRGTGSGGARDSGVAPDHGVGASIGRFYTWNTLGNILGSLLTGFLFIELLGLRTAFAVAIGANLAGGIALALYNPERRSGLTAGFGLAALMTAVFLFTVPRDVFIQHWARMEDRFGKIIFFKEEASDTVMVAEYPNGARWIRFFDGRGTAGTASEVSNRIFGHIPMLLSPNPERVLSICFGVGNTLSALAQYRPERLVCLELSPGAIEAAGYFPSNRDVLNTPNLEVVVEDGRSFLQVSREEFDVIQLEPPEIHTASVVNLYTREFYEAAIEHLADDGVLCQWINVIMMPEHEMKMLIRTFVDAFPNCSLWSGGATYELLLIGSPGPIRLSVDAIRQRFDRPRVRADLTGIGIDSPERLLSLHVMDASRLREYVSDVRPITDDWTYVDFSVPRSAAAGFGVFTYSTFQYVMAEEDPERLQQRYELLSERRSAAYLFERDHRAEESDMHRGFFDRLEEESDLQRQNARAMKHLSAGLAIQKSDRARAIDEFRKAVEIMPNHVFARNYLGQVLVERGDVDEAIDHYRHAISVKPDFYRAHNNLGFALAKRGEYAQAIEHFQQALRIWPDYEEARENLRAVRKARSGER